MPANSKFGFKILVNGTELPEYAHPEDDSRMMVESILLSPVTYWLNVKEYSSYSQEMEEQKWPVTPYEIKVFTQPSCPYSMFKVLVDGVLVKKVWLDRGESKIVEGFVNKDESTREFLFSLPRFAEDEKDRVESGRSCHVGKVEVIRCDISFSHEAMGYSSDNAVDFVQANKKDVTDITKRKYTMTTTRQGKVIRNKKPYERSAQKMMKYYNITGEVGKLSLEYHMTHTLIDWGIHPVRPTWNN